MFCFLFFKIIYSMERKKNVLFISCCCCQCYCLILFFLISWCISLWSYRCIVLLFCCFYFYIVVGLLLLFCVRVHFHIVVFAFNSSFLFVQACIITHTITSRVEYIFFAIFILFNDHSNMCRFMQYAHKHTPIYCAEW